MNLKVKSREDYEDVIHDMIHMMLPKIEPSNIRPAFNKNGGNITAKNMIGSTEDEDGLIGFTNHDNFVYFSLYFDDNTDQIGQAEIYSDDTVEINRAIKVNIYNYGDDCMDMAILEKGLVRSQTISNYINGLGIYLLSDSNIIPVTEYINEEPWTRCDLTIVFNEVVKIIPLREIEMAKGVQSMEVIRDGENN